MELIKKANDLLDRSVPFLTLVMLLLFVIHMINEDVDGMVGTGFLYSWLRFDHSRKVEK